MISLFNKEMQEEADKKLGEIRQLRIEVDSKIKQMFKAFDRIKKGKVQSRSGMLNNLHILVVDDMDPVTRLTKSALEAAYKAMVSEAHDVTSAMEVLEQRQEIHVILVDINLNDPIYKNGHGGGVYLAKKVRERWPCKIVIHMTGYDSLDMLLQSRLSGADDYLRKPFRIDELARLIAIHAEKVSRWIRYDQLRGCREGA